MKALVYHGPKDLRIDEVSNVTPKAGEVLVKIKACGICGSDVHGYLGITGRRIEPMIMGHEFSGEIVQLGEGVSNTYQLGDRVTVQPVDFCGTCENCTRGFTHMCLNKRFFGVLDVDGAMAEYLSVPEKLLYKLPDNIGFSGGALIEALAVAYCGVKKAGDLKDKNVLIVGGGTIGQLVLSVVKTMQPKSIILSDLSEFRLECAKKLGATHVINPQTSDFKEQVKACLGETVDVAVEAVGITATVGQGMSVLKPGGTYIWIGNSSKMIEVNMQDVVTKEYKVYGSYIYTHEQFGETIDFLANNALDLSTLITKEISVEEGPEMFEELVTAIEKYLKVVIVFE